MCPNTFHKNIKKQDNQNLSIFNTNISTLVFFNEITQPFLYLEKAPQIRPTPNTFHNNIKKHSNENLSIFNTNFNIQHPVKNDMIHTLIEIPDWMKKIVMRLHTGDKHICQHCRCLCRHVVKYQHKDLKKEKYYELYFPSSINS